MVPTKRIARADQEAILAVLGLSGAWMACSWSIFPWLRDQMAVALLEGSSIAAQDLIHPPASVLAALAGTLAGLIMGVIVLWIQVRRNTGPPQALAGMAGWSGRRLATVVGLITALAGISLLASGDPTIMDAKSHVARGHMWESALRAGTLPQWTPLWYGGMPADLHYPPLSHVLQGILGLGGASPYVATKIVAWLAQILGGIGFALWAARFYRSSVAGLLGGLLYALAPTLHASWIWEGRLPGILLLGLAPWLFYFSERIVDGDSRRADAGGLATVLWLCVMAHSGQARILFLLWGFYWIARTLVLGRENRSALPRVLLWSAVGITLGFTAIGATLVPVLREASWVNDLLPSNALGWRPHLPDLSHLLDLLRWNPRGSNYLGLSILVAGGLALASLRSSWQRQRAAIALLLLCLPIVFTGGVRRELDFFFFGAILLASGCGIALSGRRKWIALVLLLVIDLGPLQWINSYSVHRGSREAMYERIEGTLGNGRFLEIPANRDGSPWASHWYYSPTRDIRAVGGPFIQGAPTTFAFEAALIDSTASALASWKRRTGSTRFSSLSLPAPLLRLLAFHNIEQVWVVSGRGPLGDPIHIPNASPAFRLQSPETGSLPSQSQSPSAPIVSRGLPEDISRSLSQAQLQWIVSANPHPIEGVRYERSGGTEWWELPETEGGSVRLQRSPYPTTEVQVDGRPASWEPGPWGGIVVELTSGAHQIEARTPPSPLRRRLFRFRNLLVLLSLLLFATRIRSDRFLRVP